MLFTIGYATKSVSVFIAQLKSHNINAVADVRSVPYSKAFYDYHRERIEGHLARADIRYVYLGDELGPRSPDDDHYDERGQVQFDRLMESERFLNGIERLRLGIERGYRIALMCAEKDPANCHRSTLIAHAIRLQCDLEVCHITHDGNLESQTELAKRLVIEQELGSDLFVAAEDHEKEARLRHLKKTAYRRSRS